MAEAAAQSPANHRGRERRGVGHQLVWVSSGRVLAAGLQACSLILAARAMPVSDFGLLMAFFGVVTLIQAFADFGVGTFISKERAASPSSGGVGSALRFTTTSSVVVVVLVAGGLVITAILVSPVFWAMLPLAIAAAGERNADTRLAVAFADGDVHISVLNLVLRRSTVILAFVVLLAVGVGGLLAFSLSSGIAAAASAAFANIYIRRRVITAPSLTFRELLSSARPYWVAGLASQARNLDALLVASLAGAGQAGLYASGSRLINPLQILPSSLASVLLPASARSAQSRQMLRKLVTLSLVLLAGLTVIYAAIFLAAPLLVRLALGERYDGSVAIIRVILLGLPFASAGALLIPILQGRGHGRAVATASTTSTAVCLLGVAAAAPTGGAIAAAAMLSISFLIRFLALGQAFRRLWLDAEEPPVPAGSAPGSA